MAYIPRSSLMNTEAQSAIPLQVKRRHTVRVFNLITTTLLVFALLGTVGVFLYKDVVTGQSEAARKKLDSISATNGELNVKKIEEIRVYDTKLNIARTLLDNHLSATALLSEIERTTKGTVQFTDFEYTYDPGYEVMLTLSGNTKQLSSVALQKMQILKDGIFANFTLSDISTSGAIGVQSQQAGAGQGVPLEEPAVEFQVKGIFKKSLMEYDGVKQPEPILPPMETASTAAFSADMNIPPAEHVLPVTTDSI